MERKPYYGSGNRGARPISGRSRSAPSGGSTRGSVPARSGGASGGARAGARPSANRPPRAASGGGQRTTSVARGASVGGRGAAPGSRTPSSRKAPPRRRRRRSVASRLIPLAMLAGLLFGGYQVGSAWLISKANESTYCSNIYVNGLDVSAFGREEGEAYVLSQIEERLSTVYTLSDGEQSFSFSAANFDGSIDIGTMMNRAWNIGHIGNIFDRKRDIQSLKENPIYLNAPLTYDEELIDSFVEEIYAAVYVEPQDATVVVDLDQPHLLSESASGQELDRETARANIISLLETGEGESHLPIVTLNPTLDTTTALESMELIVEYQTDTSFRDASSTYNVRKALNMFSGQTIYPGQTVDFNEWVGPRTEERGWYEATEFMGNTTTKGWGGGICQASSTLYGAMLKAGMTIISRHPHSMTVAYVEPSLDAAVTSSGSKNLVFCNNTDTPIYILTEVTREMATVRVYGKRPEYRYELESVMVSQDSQAVNVYYIPDTEGKYCYYENETKLYKKGKAACSSQGWIVSYDWDTGEEVSRSQLSYDIYESGTDYYWIGVHSLNEGTTASFS